MLKRAIMAGPALGAFVLATFFLMRSPAPVQGQDHPQSDEQVSGPYEVIKNWPKPLSTLWPAEKGWTWGATQAIYAQNPDRIFISMRGELPIIKPGDFLNIYDEAQNVEVPGLGEGGRSIWLTIPQPGVPTRNASVGPMSSPGEPHVKFRAQEGRDYRWQHLIFIVNSQGDLVDDWSR